MAGLGVATAGGEQPFMVSSLPLVFCDGRPVALENMPDRSLVKFVRFMLKCALGVDESRLKTVRRPAWWPRTVPYFNLKASSEVEKGHAERLRDLVRSCYRGVDCEYLVRFCADLERHCISGKMAFKNNFDGSSSLYELATNRLVVTCRNENREYDLPSQGPLSPRRHLLPRQLSRGGASQQQLAMVQPPPGDIFLCDTCSAEFTSVDAVQAHERQCGVPAAAEGPPSDTESVGSEPEAECASQTRFLSYVGLAPADGSGKQPYSSPSKRGGGGGAAAARLRRGPGLLVRYQTVDVSSPLGLRLGAGPPPPPPGVEPPEHEHYCEDTERKRLGRQPAFPVSWRPPRNGRRIMYGWSHLYCFTAPQRAEKRRTVRTGLTDQARRLVRTVLPCSVRLTRVSAEEITEACRPRPQPVPVPAAPVWRPPTSVQGVLWRPLHSFGRPGPWSRSGRNGAHSAAPAAPAAAPAILTAAAAAAAGGVSSLREFRPVRSGVPAVAIRSGTARRPVRTFSLPRGISVTPRQIAPSPRGRAAFVPFSQLSVWQSAGAGAGGGAASGSLVRGRGVMGGVPRRRGGLKKPLPAPTPTPSRPPIGKELRDNDTVVIDLCSSSDEEGDPPPAAPPQPPPPPRIKQEAGDASPAAASTNGAGTQSKNAHSHWSRSCGGLTNGVNSFTSLDAGRDCDDGGSSDRRMTAVDSSADGPRIGHFAVTRTCADSDSVTIGSERHVLVVPAEGNVSCDAVSTCDPSVGYSSTLQKCSWAETSLPSTDDGPHSGRRDPSDAKDPSGRGRHRAALENGCAGSVYGVGSTLHWTWTVACRAA